MQSQLSKQYDFLIIAPTAAPVGVSAYNRSSTALEVTWGEVPFEGRNGMIRMYIIYYKLKSAQEKDWAFKEESGSVNTSLIIGLKYWSLYEIKVAAKTIKEGIKSDAVLARTDEDGNITMKILLQFYFGKRKISINHFLFMMCTSLILGQLLCLKMLKNNNIYA